MRPLSIAVLLCALVSCGGGNELAGTWKIGGCPGLFFDTVEFTDTHMFFDGSVGGEVKYETDGDMVTVTGADGKAMRVRLDGGEPTFLLPGMECKLSR